MSEHNEGSALASMLAQHPISERYSVYWPSTTACCLSGSCIHGLPGEDVSDTHLTVTCAQCEVIADIAPSSPNPIRLVLEAVCEHEAKVHGLGTQP